MFCKNCGAPVEDGVLFCEKCGYKVDGDSTPVKKKKSPVKIILIIIGILVLIGAVGFGALMLFGNLDDKKQAASEDIEEEDEILDIDTSNLSKEDKKYLKSLEDYLDDYDSIMNALNTVEDTEDYDVYRGMYADASASFKEIKDGIASLSAPENMKQLQDASCKLLDESVSFADDASELMAYFTGVSEVVDLLDNCSDDYEELYDTFYTISEYFNDVSNVPAPVLDSHKNLADYFDYANDAIATLYYADEMEYELGVVDYFRYNSANMELDRAYAEMDMGMNYWISDLEQQTNRIIARTDFIDNQFIEIKNNVDAIRKGGELTPISILDVTADVKVDYDCINTIYPALYNREDYVVHMAAYSDYADTDVIVTVSVEGFSQEYSKKITLSPNMVQLYILPPVLSEPGDLTSAKDTQININVSNASTGEVYVQDTAPIHIMSRNDVSLGADWDDDTYCMNFLAMLTPEAPVLDEVKRRANEILNDKGFYGLVGYQVDEDESAYQAIALQLAMSDFGVLYDSSSFSYSASDAYNQRVKFPSEVIEKKSGLCVETSLTLASMAMSLDMNAYLIFPPGHCMVAVELDDFSGDYILIETTVLPTDLDSDFCWAGTADELDEFLLEEYGEYSAIACSVAKTMNFQTLNY